MQMMTVLLKTKSEDGEEEFRAEAEASVQGDSLLYRFAADGARFEIRLQGKKAVIERTGAVSYRLELVEGCKAPAAIRTPYGILSVSAHTKRAEILGSDDITFQAEYVLEFEGVRSRHEIHFCAENASQKEGG